MLQSMHFFKRQRTSPSIPESTMSQTHVKCTSHEPLRGYRLLNLTFAAMLFATSMPTFSCAFSLTMDYRPPVKSSVSKIHDRRMPRSQSSYSSSPSASITPPGRSSSRKDAFASVYVPESVPSPAPSAFERRMRELALGAQNNIIRKKETEAQRPPNVHVISSLEEYKKVVGEEKDRVVAVRFHATWCRACKAVAPLFYRLATVHEDIVFVDVPVTQDNAVIHQGLGVPSLPYGHIYHPRDGLVEELKLTRKDIQEFEDALIRHKSDLMATTP